MIKTIIVMYTDMRLIMKQKILEKKLSIWKICFQRNLSLFLQDRNGGWIFWMEI